MLVQAAWRISPPSTSGRHRALSWASTTSTSPPSHDFLDEVQEEYVISLQSEPSIRHMISSFLCAQSLLNIGRVSTMRQGVWRLAGAFRTAYLEPSSRFSTCAPVHKRQGQNSKAANKGKPGQLLDHNGRPLSDEAVAVAREYWRLQKLRQSSPSPPSHMLLHEIQLHRAAYNHVVLNLSRAPGTPVTVTYEPPYIAPSSNECTASHRDTTVRGPRIDLKSEKHTPWQHIHTATEEFLKVKQKETALGAEDLPELASEQQRIVELAERGDNIFYTGSAGSGKSRVLRAIVRRLKEIGKKVQVVAPTGKAAFNVNGITTWSYVGWSPGLTRQSIKDLVTKSENNEAAQKRIQGTDVLIIDEISMVENHHFERLNEVHKRIRHDHSPFGGVQVIVVGDFCQLPPVLPFELCYRCGSRMDKKVSKTGRGTTYTCKPCKATFTDDDRWAFRSKAWKECNFNPVYLNQIHRQRDLKFIEILQKCRVGACLTDQDIDSLVNHASNIDKNATKLFPTRSETRLINDRNFFKLPGKPRVFKCIDTFQWNRKLHPELRYLGERNPLDGTLTALKEQVLESKVYLKEGMPVVLFQNLNVAKGLVNGSQGVVVGFETVPRRASRFADRVLDTNRDDHYNPEVLTILEDEFLCGVDRQECPKVEFPNGEIEVIRPIIRVVEYGRKPPYTFLARVQLPLGPAWAMTIHRSQGLTMDRVAVDLSKAFATGQSYVALSRAKSLEGLKVEGDLGKLRTGMGLDQAVKDFMDKTFGDQWTKNSVPERFSVPPIHQAVDNTDLARIKARNQSGSTWEKLLNWWMKGGKRDDGPGHV